MKKQVMVSGAFDDLRSRDVRFLEEAARFGELSVVVWPDTLVHERTHAAPRFPLPERVYFLRAIRYVSRVFTAHETTDLNAVPLLPDLGPATWVDTENESNAARSAECRRHQIEYQVIPSSQLSGFDVPIPSTSLPERKKVLVTGCYDWLHSGHVRFFEEASAHGDLYVIVGHDANIRLLKGPGHPMLNEKERRYMVGSIRYVKQALVSSGQGWLDADPEVRRLKPDIYAVNEDGDKGGKREYCRQMGMEYLVLKRTPAPGLPPRSSTDLRGF